FALLEALATSGVGRAPWVRAFAGAASHGPAALHSSEAAREALAREDANEPPHWQRLLVELRGSSAQSGLGDARWTQKALAQRTGISVKRVSEFPQTLNSTAAQKLAAHVPEWEATREAPPLVEAHKGAVSGATGAWVYYRLTPAGEELAEQVHAQLISSGAVDPESARNPLPFSW
ncbi:MAG TPA: hypothetical protein VMK65_11775, partial [Longimicrobiales bacterium]|nr:hypothetical protein [Longimicrobiales bacterium]